MSEWRAEGDCVWGPLQGEKFQLIAQTFDGDDKANARLIAAVPDLLDALEDVMRWFEQFHKYPDMGDPDIDKYRAAIVKATGGK